MKIGFCILFLLCPFIQAKAQLDIGQKLDGRSKIIKSILVLDNSASIEKGYEVVFQEISYRVILNGDKTIKAIFTSDKNFITEDNIRVGMPLASIKERLDNKSLRSEPGWAQYYASKTGWSIAFDFNSTITDSSKVQFVFKRQVKSNH
jgi:hypothetical protein